MTDEIRARNLMSTVAHLLANAVRKGAYPSFEAFLEAFSTALTARMGIVDSEQEPRVRAWMSTLQKQIGPHGEKP